MSPKKIKELTRKIKQSLAKPATGASRSRPRLGIAGHTAEARAAYHDFLTLWRDADPDIPILKEAKTEYAKQ